MTMRRLITLMILLAFAVTNGAAMATAMCRHQSNEAHVAARESHDGLLSTAAMREEAAAKAVSKKASATDTSSSSIPGYMLPPADMIFPVPAVTGPVRYITASASPPGRSLRPLLEPPLV